MNPLNNVIVEQQVEQQVQEVTVQQLRDYYEMNYGSTITMPLKLYSGCNMNAFLDLADELLYSSSIHSVDDVYDIIAKGMDTYDGRIY